MIDSYRQDHLAIAASWWWVEDVATEKIEVSPSITASLGYDPAEITRPEEWSRIVHDGDIEDLLSAFDRVQSTSEIVEVRIRYIPKHRLTHRTMLCRMQSRHGDGFPITILGVNREIDDISTIEEEILARNDDLAQVASVLSHDFRGPARHISGCTERLLEQIAELKSSLSQGLPFDFTPLEKWTHLLHRSGDRLGKMIEHVLQYSRAGTQGVSPENIDTREVVDDVLRDYADRIFERGVRVNVKTLPSVYYDRTMLYLLLANLVSNAIKFSKKDDRDPVIKIRARSIGRKWVGISVRDYGIGFTESQSDKIMDMGFRLHHESEYAGFGYGLAIVRRILHRGGGELQVRSRPGEGSEFVLKLPPGRVVRA